MNQVQMRGRCPDAELLSSAELKDYRLAMSVFSPVRLCGCADVVPSPGDSVFGLLYRLNDVDRKRIDYYEGVPMYYRPITINVHKDGEVMEAFTYEVVDKQENLKSSKEYMSLLQNAAREFNFPKAYQDFLSSIAIE
jgi:hypothetical protein